jgi:hypothetical protein
VCVCMYVKCSFYVVYDTVIHIHVQYMSVIYCGSHYAVKSSRICVTTCRTLQQG